MTARIPRRPGAGTDLTDTGPCGPRPRDAAGTRQLLLEAARNRFAQHGYAATTVRNIADDAGVNVALISRYFTSKEGLFGACLPAAADELSRTADTVKRLSEVPKGIAQQIAGCNAEGHPNQIALLLLLRSSGDERTEEMRLDVLRRYSQKLASAAGWAEDDLDSDQLMLRAQLLLAASLGTVLMRLSTPLEPLASATEQDLAGPLHDLITGLLSPPKATAEP